MTHLSIFDLTIVGKYFNKFEDYINLIKTNKEYSIFFKANKKQIMTYAKANTHYNADGQATISRDDEWFHDDVWEKDVREVNEAGKREYSYTTD